ncbi:hypothetical protein AB6A23_01225 [Paenibacillus tarimensis]
MNYRRVSAACLTAVILLLALPFAAWQIKEKKPLNIFVVDKTVPTDDYREHFGLFWILENSKITKSDHKFYRAEFDYYGHDPTTGRGERNLSFDRRPDMIYVADTYGVYEADYQNRNIRGDRSALLYGGLTVYEWNQIMDAKGMDGTLIMEFNSIASPTSTQLRTIIEKSLGVSWTGWIGRYFSDLQSSEVPEWMKSKYEAQTGQPWTFHGEAIAFVDETGRLVLLREEDFHGKVRFELTEEGRAQYPRASNSVYGYWFDVMIPGPELVTDAHFSLELTEGGASKLESNGIPLQFPAAIRHPVRNDYYFSGDYADIDVQYFAKWSLPKLFYRFLSYIREDEQFFWMSYKPMMEQILGNIYSTNRQES